MKIISFDCKINHNIINIFLFVIQIIVVFLKKIFERNEIKKNKEYNYFESYLITSFGNISYIFGILLYILKNYISYKNNKKKESKNSN